MGNERRLRAHEIGPAGVCGVWPRHELEMRQKRLLRLETALQDDAIVLSEEQMRLLKHHSVDFRRRHIEASRPGELLNQHTLCRGCLKGVGKVSAQVVVDVPCSLVFAKVNVSTMPITACDLLCDRVLPLYETFSVYVGAVLMENGREL